MDQQTSVDCAPLTESIRDYLKPGGQTEQE